MDYTDTALTAEQRAHELLRLMTVEEKAAQLDILRGVEFASKPGELSDTTVSADSDIKEAELKARIGDRGIGFIHDIYSEPSVFNKYQKHLIENSRLGIPAIFTGEALHGISFPGATIFPTPMCLAASFDKEAVHETGKAIAAETRSLGMHEILAPNLDVSREPRWGRSEETFGEDTYLSSQMAYAIITGEQNCGEIDSENAVVCEPKHFCVHGIPENGVNCSVARCGAREVEQYYLPVFETAIKEAGAYNVMACYNSIDYEVVISSKHYLTDILKTKLGLKGYARADWGAVGRLVTGHKTAADDKQAICDVINAGLDTQGCCDYDNDIWESTIVDCVKNGKIPKSRIDDAVLRVLTLKFRLGLFEHPYTDENKFRAVLRCDRHKNIAESDAEKGIVMLKNSGVLPLKKTLKSISVVGPLASSQQLGGYSSTPHGYSVNSVYDELKKYAGNDINIKHNLGCSIPFGEKSDKKSENAKCKDELKMISDAVEASKSSDVIIAVCGDSNATRCEGGDKANISLAGYQGKLIEELSKLKKPLVLLLENSGALAIANEYAVSDAVLVCWCGGEFGAKAIIKTLFGENNPAGRLPVSFPADGYRLPCYYSRLPNVDTIMYEGDIKAMFPFGYGLSYTSFEYSDMKINKTDKYNYTIEVSVINTGFVPGDEVVQLYVNDVVSSIATPEKLLKGFERIHLEPNEEKSVLFKLDFDSFKLLNKDYKWVVEPGEFGIMAGASSDDIRLKKTLTIEG